MNMCDGWIIWGFTYRHITAYNMKSARCSEFGAQFNVVHILYREKKTVFMKMFSLYIYIYINVKYIYI